MMECRMLNAGDGEAVSREHCEQEYGAASREVVNAGSGEPVRGKHCNQEYGALKQGSREAVNTGSVSQRSFEGINVKKL